jgi:hypothetical protein
LFSVPAALTAGNHRQEFYGGQWDILSTMPAAKSVLNSFSWCICCWVLLLPMFGMAFLFFLLVLDKSTAFMPSVALLLGGVALGAYLPLFRTHLTF